MQGNVVSAFLQNEEVLSITRHGNGHINDTYLVETDRDKYILQRINTQIFGNPDELMSNILGVTTHLKDKIREQGGDDKRQTLTVIKTADGKLYYRDENRNVWRMYLFIKDSVCLERAEGSRDFYESGVAFGRFQELLSDYDAGSLYATIPDFHNTPKRCEDFERSVVKDICGRAQSVLSEIEFVRERKEKMARGQRLLVEKKLPLRVTHNDTKLNNIMMDKKTGKTLAIIDLDTVMPGLSIYDFGDSIRFGANTACEDERDLSKVSLDMELFEAYAEGFIKGAVGGLTKEESSELVYGAWNMTMECGMRFLTDYLAGDTYFKTSREGQNLDRARNQFALARDMEEKEEEMKRVIRRAKERGYA
jgi:hypothetical protein